VAIDVELMRRKITVWRTLLFGFGSRCPRQELDAEGARSHGAPYGPDG
jgi:hypothetical protein